MAFSDEEGEKGEGGPVGDRLPQKKISPWPFGWHVLTAPNLPPSLPPPTCYITLQQIGTEEEEKEKEVENRSPDWHPKEEEEEEEEPLSPLLSFRR